MDLNSPWMYEQIEQWANTTNLKAESVKSFKRWSSEWSLEKEKNVTSSEQIDLLFIFLALEIIFYVHTTLPTDSPVICPALKNNPKLHWNFRLVETIKSWFSTGHSIQCWNSVRCWLFYLCRKKWAVPTKVYQPNAQSFLYDPKIRLA